jgi:hypothetical protein
VYGCAGHANPEREVPNVTVTPTMRLAWFGAVAFVAIFGLGNLAEWVADSFGPNGWWAIDLQLVLDAGARLGSGASLYSDPKFLYPPLAAVVAAPLSGLDPLPLSIIYAALKVATAATAVVWLTRGWDAFGRILALVGLLTCLPFLHDVWLGNANTWLVGAMAWAAFGRPRWVSGVALGLAAAVFAKPLLLPFFLWLIVARRPVLAGAIATGLGATVVGAVLAGPAAYVDWVNALFGAQRFATPFAGNHGVSAVVPELWVPVALVTAVAFLVVLAFAGRSISLIWAVTCGILIAPYAGTYSALTVVVALPVLGPALPVFTLLIVGLSPIATTIPLPLYAAAILAGSLAMRARAPVAGWSVRTA